MLNALTQRLEEKNALVGELHPAITLLAKAISSETIPLRMKYTIAVSEMVLFASQFKRNIAHWDGSSVPVNCLSFAIMGSGRGKDSSVQAVRKCFKSGYDLIAEERKRLAKNKAVQAATAAGEADAHLPSVYEEFYKAPNPLFVAPSTVEGFIQHLNELSEDAIGAGYQYTGEFGAELSSNPLMVENLKLLSELYDLGNKEVKMIKNKETQSREIIGLPTNALFVGSPKNLLYNEDIKQRIKVELESKLARRSNFCFCPEIIPEKDFEGDIEAMLAYEANLLDKALTVRNKFSASINTLTIETLARASTPIMVDQEVIKLFTIYQKYNQAKSDEIDHLFPLSKLARMHLQWKALKLAGAFAFYDSSDSVTEEHYIYAIRYCELLDKDLRNFEIELVKEPYEVFADYMQSISVNGKATLGLHVLRKLGYVNTKGNPEAKMKELVHLATAYDNEGIYSIEGTDIVYEKLHKSTTFNISYKEIDSSSIIKGVSEGIGKKELSNLKALVATQLNDGFAYDDVDLLKALKADIAYSPFEFKQGIRTKEHLVNKTNLLVLDVDNTTLTLHEAHFLLQDINHYIMPTADVTNELKYRVILQLDSLVELDDISWRNFTKVVAEDLGLDIDLLPQSQIFYSYKAPTLLYQIDATPLPVRDFVVKAKEMREHAPGVVAKKLSHTQKQALLADELVTFLPAFEAKNGEGSRKLVWAAKYAFYDLDLPKDEVIELVERINDYWIHPLDRKRLENTIIRPIERWPETKSE